MINGNHILWWFWENITVVMVNDLFVCCLVVCSICSSDREQLLENRGWNPKILQNSVEHYLDFFFRRVEGQNNFETEHSFNFLLEIPIWSNVLEIKMQIGTINWDIETYRNKLEKLFFGLWLSKNNGNFWFVIFYRKRMEIWSRKNLQRTCKWTI